MATIHKQLPEWGASVLINCRDTLESVAYPRIVFGRNSEQDVNVAHVLQALCLEVLELSDKLNEETN